MSKKRTPRYLLHKATGQARVRINGKDLYLGKHGSPESRAKYDEVVAEWLRDNREGHKHRLTIGELSLQYMAHAGMYYRKNGKPTSEISCIKIALRFLNRTFSNSLVFEFDVVKLESIQQAMVEEGFVRTSINRHVGRIRRMFRWGQRKRIVPREVLPDLQCLDDLKSGRSDAVESEPVKPVPLSLIDSIEPFVSRQVWAMVQLQLLTGARPGEIRIMRACDIIMTGRIWEYRPRSHKAEHHGKDRIVFIGPKAQEIVREFLKTDTSAYLFSPRDAVGTRTGKRSPGEFYSKFSYRQAIAKACDKAEIPHWHPNQLRHNAGTLMRREFGIEATRTVLGHSQTATTEIYAERDFDTARDVIGKIG